MIDFFVHIFPYSKKAFQKEIEIPDNPNLKITIDYMSAPSHIITYYFYDDSIIETNYSGGVLPSGPSSSTTTTKYYFTEEIDLTKLRNFIDGMPKVNKGLYLIEVTEKDGTSYGIDVERIELLMEIMNITNKSIREEESKRKM